MAILIVEIAMLIAGIIALLRGEIPLTKVHYVDGWPARIAGFILLLPLPLTFVAGLILRAVLTAQGRVLQPGEIDHLVLYFDLPLLALCGFLPAGICLGSAAADAWKGKTYLSDTEGSLGSWNTPYLGSTTQEGATKPRPKRKKKRSRARQPAASSGTGIMLSVVGIFLVLGLLVSGGAVWMVHKGEEQEPVAQKNRANPAPVAQINPPVPGPVAADPPKNPGQPVPQPDPVVAAGPNQPRPAGENKAEAKPSPAVKPENKNPPAGTPAIPPRPPFGDGAAKPLVLLQGKFQTSGQLGDTDPFDRGSQKPAKLFLINLEAGQVYYAEMKQDGGTAVLPDLRLEELAGQELAADRNHGRAPIARLLYLAPRTGTYRLVATTTGIGGGGFLLSVRQVQDGDPLEIPAPMLPVAAQPLRLAKQIKPYLAAAITPDSRSAWVAFPGGRLVHISCPDFAAKAAYQLPRQAYQLALDGRGILYAIVQRSEAKPASTPWANLGVADLHLYNIRSLPPSGKSLTPTKVISLRGIVQHLVMSPDDSWLYYLDTHNRKVGRVDLKQAKLDRETNQFQAGTNALCLTPNGKSLYTCSSVNVVQRLDAATLRLEKTIKFDQGKPDGIQATDTGYVLLTTSEGHRAQIYLLNANRDDKAAGAALVSWTGVHQCRSIRLAPDQKCLYAACSNLAQASIVLSYYISDRPAIYRGQTTGSINLGAPNARGLLEASRDGRFVFCDCGAILLSGR
jgi:hypothetical protein